LWHLAIAALALAAAVFIARPTIRFGLTWVARARSQDLFLLSVLLTAFGTALAVRLAGLAPPIGAFIAGMVIGESDFRHQVEDDIRPFRDALVGLFFVTVGMQLDLSVVFTSPGVVFCWLAVFILGKAFLAFLVGTIMRWPLPIRVRTALILAHGGEFGLLLLTLALTAGSVAQELGQPILMALAITMGIAPLLIQRNGLADCLVGGSAQRMTAAVAAVTEASAALENHVLLCGCGRVGRLVALTLEAAKIPYVALEFDVTRFRQAKHLGHNVVFGDARRGGILAAAGLGRARLLVITFDRRPAVERILHLARRSNPLMPRIVSAGDAHDVSSLAKAGATVVFPENLAAGLALADQTLLMCGLTQDRAAQIITAIRAELNPELRDQVGL
jgi:CPA2 family monovalent cation:H+ antiporter-2